MALELRNTSLFGLDLGNLWGGFRSGWSQALRWPIFAWLSPSEPVRVLLPDGSERVVAGTSAKPASRGARPRAVAVVLPDELVLVRELTLPALADDDLRQAIELDIAASSPFPPDQVAWGWQIDALDDTSLKCRVALAAPAHIDAYLAEQRPRLGKAVPELWAEAQAPIVFQGYGEAPRRKRLSMRRWAIVGMLLLVALLAVALAATPLLQLRERVFDARARFETLLAEAGPAVKGRDSLVRANERARAIQERSRHNVDLAKLLDTVTRLLPDDVYLSRFEIQGRQVRIAGFANNASALMEKLGAHGEFREVRAPSAITRQASSGKESFTIEFSIAGGEPAAPGAGEADAAASAGAAPISSSAPAAPGAAAAPAPASASAPSTATTPPPGSAPTAGATTSPRAVPAASSPATPSSATSTPAVAPPPPASAAKPSDGQRR